MSSLATHLRGRALFNSLLNPFIVLHKLIQQLVPQLPCVTLHPFLRLHRTYLHPDLGVCVIFLCKIRQSKTGRQYRNKGKQA